MHAVTKTQSSMLLETTQPMRVERPESDKPKYCMNFHGRVPLQSTKNFILNRPDKKTPTLLVQAFCLLTVSTLKSWLVDDTWHVECNHPVLPDDFSSGLLHHNLPLS